MIRLKKFDVVGQGILLAAWLVAVMLPFTREQAFVGYFMVGAWQLTSTIVHYLKNQQLILVEDRSYYERILIILMVGLFSFLLPDITVIYLYLLLLLSPLLALYYFYISIREYRIWSEKALVHLK